MKKNILFIIFQAFCLTGVALVTSYQVPDLSDSNWDTVLFLTPIGIIKNFLDENPLMRSFYFDSSPGIVILSGWKILALLIFTSLFITSFIRLNKMLAR
jgi:hypothetical protein